MGQPATYVQSGPHFVRVKSFGEVLRLLREEQGISYNALGNLVGCTKSDAKAWEKDESFPNGQQLGKLFNTFHKLRYFARAFEAQKTKERIATEEPATPNPEPPPEIKPPPPPKNFAEALKAARIHEGLEQSELAELLDKPEMCVVTMEIATEMTMSQELYEALLVLLPQLAGGPLPKIIPKGAPMPTPMEIEYKPANEDTIASAGVEYAKALKECSEAKLNVGRAESALTLAREKLDMALKKAKKTQDKLFDATGNPKSTKTEQW